MRLTEFPHRRVTLFAGHYGSGKTNLAVNYALALRESGESVTVADMDIVNPYFRTKDSAEVLDASPAGSAGQYRTLQIGQDIVYAFEDKNGEMSARNAQHISPFFVTVSEFFASSACQSAKYCARSPPIYFGRVLAHSNSACPR